MFFFLTFKFKVKVFNSFEVKVQRFYFNAHSKKKKNRSKSSSVVINFDSVGSGAIHKPVVCASAFLIILIKVEHCALTNH